MLSRGPITAKILKAWMWLGLTALPTLLVWGILAYRANPVARAASESDRHVQVTVHGDIFSFEPKERAQFSTGIVFFPGALVDPIAYAPLAYAIAREGWPVLIVSVPRRGMLGGSEGTLVFARARQAMQLMPDVQEWIVSGHSRGGAIASRMVKEDSSAISGLLLLGTSHPRSIDLSTIRIPVLKILADRDGLAEPAKSRITRQLLPPSAEIHIIQGGNHSQFGSYGFQPGDRSARISRQEQQKQISDLILEWLNHLSQRRSLAE